MRKKEFVKITKKITAATLIVMITISLTACGKESADNTEILNTEALNTVAEQQQENTKSQNNNKNVNDEIPTDDYHVMYIDDRSNSSYTDENKMAVSITLPTGWKKSASGLMETKDPSGQYTVTLHEPVIYQKLNTPEGTGWYEYSKFDPNAGMTIVDVDKDESVNRPDEEFMNYILEREGDRITDYEVTGLRVSAYYYIPKAVGGSYYMVGYYYSRYYQNASVTKEGEGGAGFMVWEFESDMPDFKEQVKNYTGDYIYNNLTDNSTYYSIK